MKDFKDYYKQLLTNTFQTDTESPSIAEESRHIKILRDNARSGNISKKEMEMLKKIKKELAERQAARKDQHPPKEDSSAKQNSKD